MNKTLLTPHRRVRSTAGPAQLLTPALAVALGLLSLATAAGQQRRTLQPEGIAARVMPPALAPAPRTAPAPASLPAAHRGILAAISSTATGGNWSDPATWVGGVVPTVADDVTIVAGATVTLDVAATAGSLTVAATGSLLTSATTAYQLQVAGSVTNNGTLDLSASTTIGSDLRFTGAGNAAFTGTGTTDIQTMSLAKSVRADVVEMTLPAFTVKGSATITDGFLFTRTTGTTPVDDMTGTLKISGTATISNRVFGNAAAYIIPATGGFWLNDANFTVTPQTGSPTVNGSLRISAGTYNVGVTTGNSITFAVSSVLTVEGGTFNSAGRITSYTNATTTPVVTFTMTGGTINASTVGNASAAPSFGFSGAVTVSGGTINIVQRSTATASPLDYNSASSVANGYVGTATLNLGTGATTTNFDFRIRGSVPNLTIDNTTNPKSAVLQAQTNGFGTVLVTPGAGLNLNGFILLQLGGTITNNGTLTGTTAGSTLYFGGSAPQTLGGSGTFTTIRSITVDNNGGGATLAVPVVTTRVNLFTGNLNGAGNLTVGDASAAFFVIQIGVAANTGTSGSITSAPVFNIGSGALQLIYAPEITARTTGFEIPATRVVDAVTISNPLGVVLAGGNLAVNTSGVSTGSLALTSGILTTSAANVLTIGKAAVALPTGSATSYVKGPLGITVNSATAVSRTFAVGDAAGWRPVVVSGITAATDQTFTATVVSGPTGGTGVSPVTGLNPTRYVRLENSANLPATARVQLSYGADDVVGNAATASVAQAATAAGSYTTRGGAAATVPATGIVSTLDLTPGNDYFVLANTEGGTLSSSVAAVCAGTNSGTLTLASNVGSIVKYQADNGSGFVDVAGTNTGSTFAFSNLTATTTFRAVILTADSRTVYSTSVTVTVNPAPTATLVASTATTFCGPGTLTLAATPVTGATYQYQLNGTDIMGATSATYTATVSASGSYTVVVSNASGCSATSAPVAVTVNPATTATFAYSGTTFCQSGANPTATVTGTAGGTFASTTGLSIDPATGAINLVASTLGTYTVTYSVAGTCPSSATASVTVTSAPVATFTYANASYCVGGTNPTPAFATGASGGAFSSTTGLVINATTGVIDLATSTAGTYVVTNSISASGGCSAATATTSVTINAAPTAAITTTTPTTFCTGGSVVLTATGGASYQFLLNGTAISGATAATYTATASGAYTVVVTNASGCPATSTATTVTVNPATTATFAYSGSTFCVSGTNAAATVTGTAGGTFASTTGLSLNTTTGAIALATSTPGTYTVTYSVAGTCPSSATASVTITAAPVAAFSYANAAYCVSGTNPAPVVPATSTAGTFSSTTGLTINATTGVITLASSTPGTYTVTNSVAASGGCAATTATASVTINATPTATLTAGGALSFCQGGSVVLTAPAGTGNTYQFQLNGTAIGGATSATYTANASGAYTVVVTNAGGCPATSAATTVVVNPLPTTPTISAAYNGTNTTLTSSATTGNQFYLNGVAITGATGQTYVVNGTTAPLGSYTVVVTNANGCISAPSTPLVVTSSVKPLAGSSLSVYPNPTHDGNLSVELTGYRKAVELTVFNALGQLVFTATVPASAGVTTKAVDMTQLPSGIYILRAKTDGGLDTRRIVKE